MTPITTPWLAVILVALGGLSALGYALGMLDVLVAVASFFLGLRIAFREGPAHRRPLRLRSTRNQRRRQLARAVCRGGGGARDRGRRRPAAGPSPVVGVATRRRRLRGLPTRQRAGGHGGGPR